jgi:phage tail sheath gpL-like
MTRTYDKMSMNMTCTCAPTEPMDPTIPMATLDMTNMDMPTVMMMNQDCSCNNMPIYN